MCLCNDFLLSLFRQICNRASHNRRNIRKLAVTPVLTAIRRHGPTARMLSAHSLQATLTLLAPYMPYLIWTRQAKSMREASSGNRYPTTLIVSSSQGFTRPPSAGFGTVCRRACPRKTSTTSSIRCFNHSSRRLRRRSLCRRPTGTGTISRSSCSTEKGPRGCLKSILLLAKDKALTHRPYSSRATTLSGIRTDSCRPIRLRR